MGEMRVDKDGLFEMPEMFWMMPTHPFDINNIPPIDFFAPRQPVIVKEEGGIEVWSEGYMATGEHGVATLLGIYRADNFAEAVERHLQSHPESRKDYHYSILKNSHSIWGCRLFDNETDARKSCG